MPPAHGAYLSIVTLGNFSFRYALTCSLDYSIKDLDSSVRPFALNSNGFIEVFESVPTEVYNVLLVRVTCPVLSLLAVAVLLFTVYYLTLPIDFLNLCKLLHTHRLLELLKCFNLLIFLKPSRQNVCVSSLHVSHAI